jgi:hypothetical protein
MDRVKQSISFFTLAKALLEALSSGKVTEEDGRHRWFIFDVAVVFAHLAWQSLENRRKGLINSALDQLCWRIRPSIHPDRIALHGFYKILYQKVDFLRKEKPHLFKDALSSRRHRKQRVELARQLLLNKINWSSDFEYLISIGAPTYFDAEHDNIIGLALIVLEVFSAAVEGKEEEFEKLIPDEFLHLPNAIQVTRADVEALARHINGLLLELAVPQAA